MLWAVNKEPLPRRALSLHTTPQARRIFDLAALIEAGLDTKAGVYHLSRGRLEPVSAADIEQARELARRITAPEK